MSLPGTALVRLLGAGTVCLFLSLPLIATVSGCGIKPADVDAPQGEEEDKFPRTYPDPSPDPNPHRYIR